MVENGAEARASDSSIVEALSGKTILLTGVTGFLAQVVFERLMADFPETRVILLVRSQTGATSRERVEYLLRKPAFDTLRERVGQEQLVKVLDERVEVIDGDFGRGVPEIPGGIDIACHSAATVAFDPPIDEGFTDEPAGRDEPLRRRDRRRIHARRSSTSRPPTSPGVQKGVIPEGPLDHSVDYRLELELAIEARHDVEAQSRKPEMLNAFLAAARKEHERAGPRPWRPTPRSAGRSGSRSAWSSTDVPGAFAGLARRLHVHQGDGRARGRGARRRGEPAAVDRAAIDHRVGATPTRSRGGSTGSRWPTRSSAPTGWARSRSSPGIPEGIIDIIPVDFVVNAILAVAANPPPSRRGRLLPRELRLAEPVAVLRAVRMGPRVLRGAPAARTRPRRAQGSRLGLPGQPHGRADAAAGRTVHRRRRAGGHPHAEVQGDARRGAPRRPRQGPRRLREAVQRPVRHVHRDRGGLHRRPHVRVVRVA